MARKKRKRIWGSGSIFQRNGRWRIVWHEGGRRRSKSFVDRDLAERVLAKITGDLAAGAAGMVKDYRGAPTLDDLAKPWFERRTRTHRDTGTARSRWNKHISPAFGKLKPCELDSAKIRDFVQRKLAAGLNPTTVGHFVRLLSTFYETIVEDGHAPSNPVASLPKSTRKLYRSNYDTSSTPFLKTTADIRAVYLALPEPYNVAFAVGALAGLRTGEVLGLSWPDVDLDKGILHVRQQMQDGRLCGLKDDEPRLVPIQNDLAPVLVAWKLRTGGTGLLFQPTNAKKGGRPDLGSPPAFIRPHTLSHQLHKALTKCGLDKMSWYCCTRHTFASQWVLAGKPIEILSKIMGHSSVLVTQRYAHADVLLYAGAKDAIRVDLSQPKGNVVSLAAGRADDTKTTPAVESAAAAG